MRNNKKHDNLSVNEISAPKHIEKISNNTAQKADKEPSCIYEHERHAAGSKIRLDDSEQVCTDKGSWENK